MVSSTTAGDGTSRGGGGLGMFDIDRIGEDIYDFLFTPSTNKERTTIPSRPATPAARRRSNVKSSSPEERDDGGSDGGWEVGGNPDLSKRTSRKGSHDDAREKDGERESSGTFNNNRSEVSPSKSSSSSRIRRQSSAKTIEESSEPTGAKSSRKNEETPSSKSNSTPEQKESEEVVSGEFQNSISASSQEGQPNMTQQSSSSPPLPLPTAPAQAESRGDPLMAELKTKLKVVSQRHEAGIPWVPQHGIKVPTTPSEETLPLAARALPARYTLSHVKHAATTATRPKQDDFMKELQLWHKKHKLQKTAKKCTHDNHLLELKEWHEKKIMSPRTVNNPAEDPVDDQQENVQAIDAPSQLSKAKRSKSRSSESIKSKTEVVGKVVQRKWGLFSCFPKKKASSKQKPTTRMTDTTPPVPSAATKMSSKSSKKKGASSSSASSSASLSSRSRSSKTSDLYHKSVEQRRQRRKQKLSESLF